MYPTPVSKILRLWYLLVWTSPVCCYPRPPLHYFVTSSVGVSEWFCFVPTKLENLTAKYSGRAPALRAHTGWIFTLWSMTPVYPSSVDVGSLCGLSGFFVDKPAASKRRGGDDDDADADADDDLSPGLLLYTNIKLVTMVMMMMPLTPWYWRETKGGGKTPEILQDVRPNLYIHKHQDIRSGLHTAITAALSSCEAANEMSAVPLTCAQYALSTKATCFNERWKK